MLRLASLYTLQKQRTTSQDLGVMDNDNIRIVPFMKCNNIETYETVKCPEMN